MHFAGPRTSFGSASCSPTRSVLRPALGVPYRAQSMTAIGSKACAAREGAKRPNARLLGPYVDLIWPPRAARHDTNCRTWARPFISALSARCSRHTPVSRDKFAQCCVCFERVLHTARCALRLSRECYTHARYAAGMTGPIFAFICAGVRSCPPLSPFAHARTHNHIQYTTTTTTTTTSKIDIICNCEYYL